MTDFDDLNALAGFLDSVGRQVGPGTVIPKPNDEAVEWRGTSHGHDVRIHVDILKEIEVGARLSHSHGTVLIMWDKDMIPIPNSNATPWDDRDIVRVFVGRGTFVYAKPGVIDEHLAVFNRLPRPMTDAIVDGMQKANLRYVKIHDLGIDAAFRDLLPELPNAASGMATLTKFMGWCAAYLAATPAPSGPTAGGGAAPAGAAPVRPAEKMTCQYCRSLFLFGPTEQCTNCGAPARG